ncbi:uncharacterized protein MONOS_12299 [Monocercomonoides exilis]|uniref:uncharacterized protein n=1 Tax=Monocercomonoides exilis TaxID=2049356 RepID=UPI0035599D97|nr:hypothetical protein MONOS_12299 [Monocercomonoides exilis]|eukprot:MONOS_12299.1-p1 / transcript=MONOS_12299.1 / gene=MONOS_12299 / organism=Monocercomonoides_exilis_PA203 / gene_product=unspecified product / transcript_product=unspecified product / location=Mono_scaffold00672:22401-23752(+) / protein_length=320 / sequence_SO=supercontig / SO=protein_coding / is_pseudo=false
MDPYLRQQMLQASLEYSSKKPQQSTNTKASRPSLRIDFDAEDDPFELLELIESAPKPSFERNMKESPASSFFHSIQSPPQSFSPFAKKHNDIRIISHSEKFKKLRQESSECQRIEVSRREQLQFQAQQFQAIQKEGKIKADSKCCNCRQSFSLFSTKVICCACNCTFCSSCIGNMGISVEPTFTVRERQRNDQPCCEICANLLGSLLRMNEIMKIKREKKPNLIENTFIHLRGTEKEVESALERQKYSAYSSAKSSKVSAHTAMQSHSLLLREVKATLPRRKEELNGRDFFLLSQLVRVFEVRCTELEKKIKQNSGGAG